MTPLDFLKKELLEKGVRPSIQRIKVLEYLHQVQGHPNVDEIFASLSPHFPSLSKATIYNTLNAFARAGLIRTLSMDGLEKRFDLITHDHGHFKCDHCGEIFNFKIEIASVPIEGLSEFRITEKNVYFYGLCPNCQKLEKE
jgi:Fe2+ or Zn2+ uptake regulation protein